MLKSIKILILFSIFSVQLTNIKSVSDTLFETTKEYIPKNQRIGDLKKNETNINFEIYNKSPKTIIYTLWNPKSKTYPMLYKIEAGKVFQLDDMPLTNNDLILLIWESDKNPTYKEKGILSPKVKFSPAPKEAYRFKINDIRKTMYATYDGKANGLRPQTGQLKGLSGKTESGLSTKNNVSKEEILAFDASSPEGL